MLNYINSGTHVETFTSPYTVGHILAAQTTGALDPWPVYYFRTTFTYTGDPTQVISLSGDDLLDDGAVVYLNGVDVAHLNMPAGTVTYATLASSNVAGTAPVSTYTISLADFPGLLKQGANILAVEVRQDPATSSDVTWACSLNANVNTNSTQVVRQVVLPANITNLFNNLRITEVMYNPAGAADLEFIELQNIGTATLDLTGVRIGGGVSSPSRPCSLPRDSTSWWPAIRPTSPVSTVQESILPANTRASSITAATRSSCSFRRPTTPTSCGSLTRNTWVPSSNGLGYSMVIGNTSAPAASWNDASSWQAGGTLNGTPGYAEGLSDIVINEVLTHTDQPEYDSIELYNRSTTDTVNVSGWYLTDNRAVLKYRIPDGTVLAPGQYKVFDGHDFAIADYNGVNDSVNNVEDAGATLHMVGNGWEQVSLRDPVTYCTVRRHGQHHPGVRLQGSHFSDLMQGIGLDTDDTNDPGKTFQLAGTESYGIPVSLRFDYGGRVVPLHHQRRLGPRTAGRPDDAFASSPMTIRPATPSATSATWKFTRRFEHSAGFRLQQVLRAERPPGRRTSFSSRRTLRAMRSASTITSPSARPSTASPSAAGPTAQATSTPCSS